ncbi:2-hydroxymuconate tautomerase [Rhodoblastus acidophilus]|uniref:2-hydroxymuconate tautomerase n=1 Tax=Candidatus Rhodoblastus alkanivorans TaxID=2954117 RepID=A0ABS9ZD52_9HYPH|nr:2-hydroxymuconate tautomerase [Candidatus Rhodoblastus alkanivorans]MCI4680495.1 2-hydroxymuconate tautomerase [Candidatus Rhodoblastus alkanivorans]MCI4684977.1 2-hydroxymuconate tautomerase [Candidatus Rhodoblastus alkanivorans]MDI4643115.1 2-hydroxymuconate tautomerase [Rhodoblastus acidophilus]
MPILDITPIEGSSDEAEARPLQKVADAVHEAIEARKETIASSFGKCRPTIFPSAG